MKKKTLIILNIILIVIIIATLGITVLVKNVKEDSKKSQQLIQNIKTSYEQLNQNITKYNEKRTNLNQEISSYYQETFNESYQTAITSMKEYENIIKDINEIIEKLKNNCETNIFTDEEINNICKNYQETYKTIITTYTNDITSFNNIVETYNQNNENKLENFKTTITEAINQKEENNEGAN